MSHTAIHDLPTREAVLERHYEAAARHQDEKAGWLAKEAALLKRLANARKAKTLANKRADEAVAAMRAMLVAFNTKA